mmetsp:Transcript_18594/g.57965  ORF Transcript_18594/g.57965 Transcript_18594/m.57965 type:complete len:87 (-) Transcript_18594:156-416(-)
MGIGRDDVGGHLVANRDCADQWEKFFLTTRADDFTDPGCTLRAAIHGTQLGLQIIACVATPSTPCLNALVKGGRILKLLQQARLQC